LDIVIDEPTKRQLNDRLAGEQSGHRLPSVAAGLVRGGELIWSHGCGRIGETSGAGGTEPDGTGIRSQAPDANVQYRIGSMSKTFVAVALMRLRDEGRLSLSDPIGSYLEEAAVAPAVASMTIGQLMSHTSGLRSQPAGPWWERTPGSPFADLAGPSLGHDAGLWRGGRRFHYSNLGFAVLGELLGRLHGKPWDQVVAGELLAPLGMSRTTTRPESPYAAGFAVHPHADLLLAEPEHDAGAMGPAGQLWTTVHDLARWAGFLAGHTGGLLAAQTLAEMREPLTIADVPGQPWSSGYGLGLQVWNPGGVRSFGHIGSMPGFFGIMRVAAGSGDAAVVLSNSTAGFDPQLASDLLRILADGDPVSPPQWVPAAADPELLSMLGSWYFGPSQYVLRLSGTDTLELGPAGEQDAVRFQRSEGGPWIALDDDFTGEPLVPVRGPDGGVLSLDLASFAFTRTPYDPQAPVPGGVDPAGWHAPPG
jgi:CubicO group peptidase (beta-lactamase class C family)